MQSRERIRVLFIISDLSGGGAERAASAYLRHLDRDRFEPGLCLWRPIFAYDVPDDVPIWNVHKWSVWHIPGAVFRTASVLRHWEPDVVVSFLCYVNVPTGAALMLSGIRCGWIPYVQNNPENKEAALANRLFTPFLRRATRVCAVSKGVAGRLADYYGAPREKLVTLYNPIDFRHIDRTLEENPPEKSDVPTIITMGRLVEQKDHRTLLQAFSKVREKRMARLVILGKGPLRTDLEELIEELGLQGDVELPGFLPDPFSRVAAADVFVLSSRWEGFGNVLVEAMGTGTACVSTRCPFGPEEIIGHNETGMLVPVADPEALANAINTLLDDEQLRQRLATAGRARARSRFAADNQTRTLERLLERSLTPEAP